MESKAVRLTHLTLASCLTRLRLPATALLVALTGACEAERLNTVTDPESAANPLPATVPTFASISHSGVPFGFWRLEYDQLGSDWTALQANASTTSIIRNLETARSRRARVFIRFAGGSAERYQNSDGSFSLTKFNALLDQFKNIDLDSYIADGTLAGHMLLDEAQDPSNWGGKPIPYQTLEYAAKHSKALWPNLPTYVRTVPTWLAGASFQWNYLDGGWAQYSARMGSVDSYRDAQVRAANDEGLKVMWGLNILNGGDGSSGKRFDSSTNYSMSAAEVLKYGKALLAASNSCGFLMWMYQSDHIASSGVLDAMKTLSAEAKTRASSCGDAAEEAPPATNLSPAASFTVTCSYLSCAFKDTSSDPDGIIVERRWSFGNGSTSSSSSPARTYAAAGTYTVRLTVTDNAGATGTTTRSVTVSASTTNAAPSAYFGSACTRLSCTFTDRSKDGDGTIVAWNWSFGDGTGSTARNPSHAFKVGGTYKVKLTVTDNSGGADPITHSVIVAP